MRRAVVIVLSDEERAILEKLVRSAKTAQRLVERAKIVLAAGAGMESQDIAAEFGCSQERVRKSLSQ